MFFSKQPRLDPRRRFGSRSFRNKIRDASRYRRVSKPIDLHRKSRMMVILGFRSKAYRVLWVSVIGVIAYFFVFSDYMVIDQVSVSGTNRVDANAVKTLVSDLGSERTFLIPQSNFFLLTQNRLIKNLQATQPYVKTIAKYKRSWPNKVEVEITERDPGFILESNARRYLVDDEGVVVTDNPQETNLPVVKDQIEENFDIGKQMDNSKLVAFIISMNKLWSSKMSVPIKEIKIPGKASAEVQIVSAEDWGVFFDVSRPVSSQLNSLALILSREIPIAKRLTLAYIDLRLRERAYYCYKDSPCVAGAVTDPTQVGPDQLPATIVPKPPPPPAPKNQ